MVTSLTDQRRSPLMTKESIAALARELRRQRDTKVDYIVPGRDKLRMQLNPEGTPVLTLRGAGPQGPDGPADLSYDLTRVAHEGLGERLSIPRQYYDRMRSDAVSLLCESVNTWLDQQGGQHMLRTLDGRVRAVLSDRYKAIDSADIFFDLYDIITAAGGEIVRADQSETAFYLMALQPDWGETIEPGHIPGTFDLREEVMRARDPDWTPEKFDERFGGNPMSYAPPPPDATVYVPGIVFRNSEVGRGSLSGELCVFDLVCGNRTLRSKGVEDLGAIRFIHAGAPKGEGMIDYSDETRRLELDLVKSKVRDAARAAFDRDKFQTIVNRMRAARGVKVDEPVEAIKALHERTSLLTDADEEAILSEFTAPKTRGGQDPGRNLWGLSCAITARAGSYADEDRRIELERLGGDVLEYGVDPRTGKVRELVPVKAA